MKLFNSLTNEIEEFVPINPQEVKMYVCGPTVYNHIHIGNARPLVFFDTLRNIFEFLGYHVAYASNITDIDDRIIKASQEQKIPESEFTDFFTKAYFKLYRKLGARIPSFTPHATAYVGAMIDFIEGLLKTGYAYKSASGIYFRVGKIENFGLLSNRKLSELEEGHRVNLESDKEQAQDFALWKFTSEGIKFPASFGEGRPGWHTECVCMIKDIFDTPIDIHGGGIDLIFPHHENENAQCLAHDHHILANYWVHVNFLNMGNIKMSKSLGNVEYAKDLVEEFGGGSVRLFLLSTNYRSPITYSKELLASCQTKYLQIVKLIKNTFLQYQCHPTAWQIFKKTMSKKQLYQNAFFARFIDELNNDLNIANGISIIYELMKKLSRNVCEEQTIVNFRVFYKMLKILGLFPKVKISEEIKDNYRTYLEAKEAENFTLSDELRLKLINLGYL
jgi:cysteinyl-tRNA synthetase